MSAVLVFATAEQGRCYAATMLFYLNWVMDEIQHWQSLDKLCRAKVANMEDENFLSKYDDYSITRT